MKTVNQNDKIKFFPVLMRYANGKTDGSTGYALSIGEREYLFNQFAEIMELNNADETRDVEKLEPETVTIQEIAFDLKRCVGSVRYLVRTHS